MRSRSCDLEAQIDPTHQASALLDEENAIPVNVASSAAILVDNLTLYRSDRQVAIMLEPGSSKMCSMRLVYCYRQRHRQCWLQPKHDSKSKKTISLLLREMIITYMRMSRAALSTNKREPATAACLAATTAAATPHQAAKAHLSNTLFTNSSFSKQSELSTPCSCNNLFNSLTLMPISWL